ncbi:MAG: hypothetical protein JSU86_13810 [Phycisphaerales bacterium]|nr:MAG: hypothetical protein JSU86_13810 [Phycisphaerales bacterium]
MSTSDSEHIMTCGRTRASRRSVVLVLVLVYIVLAGSLMVLTTTSTGQLVRTGRHEHASILLRQLIDSGRAWAYARADVHVETPITLDAAEILPAESSGHVTIVVKPGKPETVLIEAQLRLHGRPFTRSGTFVARPPAP